MLRRRSGSVTGTMGSTPPLFLGLIADGPLAWVVLVPPFRLLPRVSCSPRTAAGPTPGSPSGKPHGASSKPASMGNARSRSRPPDSTGGDLASADTNGGLGDTCSAGCAGAGAPTHGDEETPRVPMVRKDTDAVLERLTFLCGGREHGFDQSAGLGVPGIHLIPGIKPLGTGFLPTHLPGDHTRTTLQRCKGRAHVHHAQATFAVLQQSRNHRLVLHRVQGTGLRLVVGDHQAGGVHALGLVDEQVATFDVGIVGHHETGGGLSFRGLHQLQKLQGLGSWCGAHVQHPMVRLDVQHERWDHGHLLLPGDAPDVVLALEEVVDLGQHGDLSDLVPGAVDVPGQIVRIPSNGPRRLQALAIHLNGPFLVQSGHQLLLEFLLEERCVLPAPVDSERGRKPLPEAFQERFPFLGRHHALVLVVFFEGGVGEWKPFPSRLFFASVVSTFEPPGFLRIPSVFSGPNASTPPRSRALLPARRRIAHRRQARSVPFPKDPPNLGIPFLKRTAPSKRKRGPAKYRFP
eukprot:scaffold2637_cov421-Pavlova_lutheri.AAC.7